MHVRADDDVSGQGSSQPCLPRSPTHAYGATRSAPRYSALGGMRDHDRWGRACHHGEPTRSPAGTGHAEKRGGRLLTVAVALLQALTDLPEKLAEESATFSGSGKRAGMSSGGRESV